MKEFTKLASWLLIIGGLLLGYEGLVGTELQEMLVGGTLSGFVEILIGVAAAYVGYEMVSGKKGK